jgi:hypothetical protein
MKEVLYLLFHLLTTIAKLLRPGGSKTIISENLLLKQQLIIHSRSRQRAPNLTNRDRAKGNPEDGKGCAIDRCRQRCQPGFTEILPVQSQL